MKNSFNLKNLTSLKNAIAERKPWKICFLLFFKNMTIECISSSKKEKSTIPGTKNSRYNFKRLAVLFKYFESQKYCAVEIAEEMRLVIYGKNQLWQKWYLISLKRVFVTGICYLLIFTLKQTIPKKAGFFLCQKNNSRTWNGATNVQWSTISGQHFFPIWVA